MTGTGIASDACSGEKEGVSVKKRGLLAWALLFLSLCSCAAFAQSPFVRHYYIPEYYPTVEEAMGRLKNIQPLLMSIDDGMLKSVEADRFGIRLFWTAGQATVIPFDKLTDLRIWHNTAFKGQCPWFVAAYLSTASEGETSPQMRTSTKGVAETLCSIITSLAAASGHPIELRGYIGFSYKEPTKKNLKDAGLKKQAGIVVDFADLGGPAEKGGLKPGDIILSVNGRPVESFEQFKKDIRPGFVSADTFILELARNGKKETLRIKTLPLDEFPVPPKTLTFGQASPAGNGKNQPPKLGFVLRNLSMSEKSALKGRTGAVILEVKPGGLAEAMKMQPGDIILFCNGKAVPSVEGFSVLLSEGENNFLLLRNGKELTVGISTVTESF